MPPPGHHLPATCCGKSGSLAPQCSGWGEKAGKCLGQAHGGGGEQHNLPPVPEAIGLPGARKCCPFQQSEPSWWGCSRGRDSLVIKTTHVYLILLQPCDLPWLYCSGPCCATSHHPYFQKRAERRGGGIAIVWQKETMIQCAVAAFEAAAAGGREAWMYNVLSTLHL